jgi:hypothetical protein
MISPRTDDGWLTHTAFAAFAHRAPSPVTSLTPKPVSFASCGKRKRGPSTTTRHVGSSRRKLRGPRFLTSEDVAGAAGTTDTDGTPRAGAPFEDEAQTYPSPVHADPPSCVRDLNGISTAARFYRDACGFLPWFSFQRCWIRLWRALSNMLTASAKSRSPLSTLKHSPIHRACKTCKS